MFTSLKRSPKNRNKSRSHKNRNKSRSHNRNKSRSKRYAKKAQLLKSELKGGSKEEDQLKYFKNNFQMLDQRKRYLIHVKPIYDLFLWNNKEVEKIIQERDLKLDYNGDFLIFEDIKPVRENKQFLNISKFVDFGTYQVENQFLQFQLNVDDNLKVFIPVFETSDGFQIGGNCYLDRYKFTSPIVPADMVKSMLIDFYQTVDPRTGSTKADSDIIERKEYLREKISKDFQDSINKNRRYILNRDEFNLYSNLKIINDKDFGWKKGLNKNGYAVDRFIYLKNLSEEEIKFLFS